MALVHPVSNIPMPATLLTVCDFRAQSLNLSVPCSAGHDLPHQSNSKSETGFPPLRNYLVEGKYVQGHFEIHAFKYAEAASMIWRMGKIYHPQQDYHPLGDLTHFTSEASYLGHLSDQLHFCHHH